MISPFRSLQEEERTETEFPMQFRNKEGKKRRRDGGKVGNNPRRRPQPSDDTQFDPR